MAESSAFTGRSAQEHEGRTEIVFEHLDGVRGQGESIDGNSRSDYLPEYGDFVADALVRGAGSVAPCR